MRRTTGFFVFAFVTTPFSIFCHLARKAARLPRISAALRPRAVGLALALPLSLAIAGSAAATQASDPGSPGPGAVTLVSQSGPQASPLAALPSPHEPMRVVARVSIARQVMEVFHEGRKIYEWPVSTARPGKVTPTGRWQGAQWLSRHHRSSRYNNAPMPFAIFYNGHYAIHGTDQIRKLGRPASAGCVRLHPDNARILFEMVRAEGKAQFRVEVTR